MHLTSTVTTYLVVMAILLPAPAATAQTSLLSAFAACEASVIDGSDHHLRKIGALIDEDERGSRVRLDTPEGTVVAMYIPPARAVSACLLWGRHPELATEFQELWQDWVEWEEAAVASETWFQSALEAPGSVDLTDHALPGYVVVRCNALEHGMVLSSQPMVANTVRKVLPELDAEREPVVHYQFSAVAGLPGRCSAAVDALRDRN